MSDKPANVISVSGPAEVVAIRVVATETWWQIGSVHAQRADVGAFAWPERRFAFPYDYERENG